MNAQEIHDLLDNVEKELREANVEEVKRLELSILARQLKMQLLLGGFDPLKDLDAVTVVDLSQLRDLTAKVGQEINNELARRDLVDKIVLIAKSGLKAAGFPVA